MAVSLDVSGRVLRLSHEEAERLRARAAGDAGLSSRARDLALVLEWALSTPRTVVLRRREAKELIRLLSIDASLEKLSAQLRNVA